MPQTSSLLAPNARDTSRVRRPRILLSIPTGFQVRQFIHSGVLGGLLEEGCEVAILTPNRAGEGFLERLQDDRITVHSLRIATGPLMRRYLAARQHIDGQRPPTETIRQKMKDLRAKFPATFFLTVAANRAFSASPSLRQAALRREGGLLRNRSIDRIFESEPFDLVVSGTAGHLHQDLFVLHAASRRGIATAVVVLSWDNLSSKGLINPHPSRLLVWSEHMKREAIELHGVPEDRIETVGAIVHDAHARASEFGSRDANMRRLGLDPGRRLIFYGTNHGGFFPDEVEVVRKMAQWVEQDDFGAPCQLWVRVHPQSISGPFAMDLEPFRKLESERVRIEFPPIPDNNLPWEFPEHDLGHLTGLLRDADAVVNSGSLSIEAAIFDKPVVCVAYDPSGTRSYDQSPRRFYDFTHMKYVVESGAVRLAESAEQLHELVAQSLRDPGADRAGRRSIVEMQFGKVDGRSAERTVAAMLRALPPQAC